MSFSISVIRYLAWLNSRYHFRGRVLLLGRQKVFGNKYQVATALELHGAVSQTEAFSGPDATCRIDPNSDHVSDLAALMALADFSEIHSLDISPYQGAEIIHDLNTPVPRGLHGQYDLIIDGGTLEHIFDIPCALRNISKLLAKGGSVIHMSPISGYVDHGFYQLSPMLFHRYYQSPDFQDMLCLVAEHPRNKPNHSQWQFWYWDQAVKRKRMVSDGALACYFSATKVDDSGREMLIQDFEADGYLGATNKEHELRPWGLSEVVELKPICLE